MHCFPLAMKCTRDFPSQGEDRERPSIILPAMNMKKFLNASHAATVITLLSLSAHADSPTASDPQASAPNVVLIMADDLGAEAIGCYGSTSYQTPHLDEMARAGIRFNNAYATPLCTPTRVMIMSGLYPQITGHRGLISKDPAIGMSTEIKTFGDYFKEAGYITAVAGKWQLCQFTTYPNHPVDLGFDRYCLWKWHYNGKKTSRYWKPAIWQDGESLDLTEETYGPDRYAQFLMDFIRENKDQPFFVYYPMALTHSPFVDPPARSLDEKQIQKLELKKQQSFSRMLSYADEIVGKINTTLEKLKIADNTLVIFTADNGTDKNIRESQLGDLVIPGGKGSMTEAGTRVPFIAKWPAKTKPGQVSEKLVSLVDLVPTLNSLAGIETDNASSGKNLSHYFTGDAGKDRDHIFVCYGKNYFVRTNDWRLHNTGDLYHIPTSSNEKRYAERKKESEKHRAALQSILNEYEMNSYSIDRKQKDSKK